MSSYYNRIYSNIYSIIKSSYSAGFINKYPCEEWCEQNNIRDCVEGLIDAHTVNKCLELTSKFEIPFPGELAGILRDGKEIGHWQDGYEKGFREALKTLMTSKD